MLNKNSNERKYDHKNMLMNTLRQQKINYV